jgi:hypothetical protein
MHPVPMHRRALLLGALAAAGGWTAGAQTVVAQPGLELLEPIHALIAGVSGLTVRVSSNGCTAKPDFAAYVERGAGQTTIAFGRKQADRCKPKHQAAHADLLFSYAELGISVDTPLTVLNPITPPSRR